MDYVGKTCDGCKKTLTKEDAGMGFNFADDFGNLDAKYAHIGCATKVMEDNKGKKWYK